MWQEIYSWSCYRHPNQSITEFNIALDKTLTLIASQNIPCIFAGDLNIDLLKYETNNDTTQFVNNLLARNFLPTILMPTRITNHSATIIDHIYYYEGKHNKCDFGIKSDNLLADITDHLANFFVITKKTAKKDLKITLSSDYFLNLMNLNLVES